MKVKAVVCLHCLDGTSTVYLLDQLHNLISSTCPETGTHTAFIYAPLRHCQSMF